MEIDLKLLQRLLNHGRIDEVGAGYPTGMDSDAPASHQDHLQTNGMGDNSLRDPSTEGNTVGKAGAASGDSAVEEADGQFVVTPKMCEYLEYIMRDRGISTAIIAMEDFFINKNGELYVGHETFSPEDLMNIASQLKLNVSSPADAGQKIVQILAAISRGLDEAMGYTKEEGEEQLDEFRADDQPVGSRFAYTVDTLGNVTVSDAEKGTSVFLQGSDAIELLGQLHHATGEGQVQHILQQYQHVMEGEVVAEADAEVETVQRAFRNLSQSLIAAREAALQLKSDGMEYGSVFAVTVADDTLNALQALIDEFHASVGQK